jgi:hypothetical protein
LNVDRWTEIETQWLSPVTQAVSRGTTTSTNALVASSNRKAEFMRRLTQSFKVEGLKPGETIAKIEFDGINVLEGAQ